MAALLRFHSRVSILLCLIALSGLSTITPVLAATPAPSTPATGALVRMDMDSTVAVLLDEIPSGPEREAAAAHALQEDAAFWTDRAARQVKLTYYRLVFRSAYYSPHAGKGPLPLPAKSVWNVQLTGSPKRVSMMGHDMVSVSYHFNTYQVTDVDSPAAVEPKLAKVKGSWSEPFKLPVDPELVLQRTGFACMDEFEYPPASAFEENTYYFYDQTCGVETPDTSSCHTTVFPAESCVTALQKHVGMVAPDMVFTRVAHDPAIASQYRVGAIENPTGADLAVMEEGMIDEHRIFYRYFDNNSCDLAEGTIASTGWRRLLAFSAVVSNNGTRPIHIGDVTDPTNPWVTSHVFEFSPCHHHYHFSHYGTFGYNGAPGSKRAFCLEDTNRFHNDETTPLTAIHQTCEYQGIGAGWGDEYEFGIPGQWVDITDVDAATPHDLTFQSNPEQFLCEGQTLGSNNLPVDPLDLSALVFDPTLFTDPLGNIVSRVRCAFPGTWNANNLGALSIASATGSFVTEPCTRGQIGPKRDCGFSALSPLQGCAPGSSVTLSCSSSGAPQILRVCEMSAALGSGVACALKDALANTLVSAATQVQFTCPAVRDAPGTGGYSMYQAPLHPWNSTDAVSCTGW